MTNKKILIIKFSGLGDVVHSTIIAHSIKLKYPEAKIHYLTNKVNSHILANCPDVDKIIVFNNKILETSKLLYKERYDTVICLNYTIRNYLLTFLSFPRKIFFRSYKGESWVDNYYYTAKQLYKEIEKPSRLYLSNSNNNSKENVLKILGKYPKPHIVINPGKHFHNSRQGRIWRIEKWKDLAHELIKEYGGTVFVNGNKAERNCHNELADRNVIVLSGLLSLEESCVLLSSADIVISGDSGPIHIASAYNTKTLALLGSTSPDKIKPYGENGYYIEPEGKCKYCWKKTCKRAKSKNDYTQCMESITVDRVMKKIKDYSLIKEKIKG